MTSFAGLTGVLKMAVRTAAMTATLIGCTKPILSVVVVKNDTIQEILVP